MVPENLRRYPRRASSIDARVEFAWGNLEGKIENIGEGGVLFVTDTLEGTVEDGNRGTVVFTEESSGSERRLPGEVLRQDRSFVAGEILRTLAVRFDAPYRPD